VLNSNFQWASLDEETNVISQGSKRRWLAVAVAVFATVGIESGQLQAQEAYPNRAVRIVVPYAAGASTDTLGRMIGLHLETKWKQSVVVENLPGAGGLTGAAMVAKSAPDGYSFVIVTASHVIAPAIMARPPFDPINDFAPVTMLAKGPGLVIASNQSGFQSLPDLIAKARQDQVNYGSSGVGSKHHVSMLEFARIAGLNLQHIPYRGSAQAMNDIVGGHLPLQIGNMSFGFDLVRGGKAKGIAVVSTHRNPIAPDIPTFTELGFPQLSGGEWWVLLAPAKTPRSIIDKVAAEIAPILKMPDVKARMPADELMSSSPEELLAFLQSEADTWGNAAKRAGLHIE
jgi:tripartite-type tricarboxylate transporter receptor subunit TctC